MENGIATYSNRNYARLRLDKHMEWHRAIDKLACQLVDHKPAIVFIGAGHIAPNSPISIQKRVRCPGTRKLVEAFEKRGNCYVFTVHGTRMAHITIVWQMFPSISTPNQKLPLQEMRRLSTESSFNAANTDRHKCEQAKALQMKWTIMKIWGEMGNRGNAIAAALAQRNTARLVSKKQRFLKTWAPNAVIADAEEDAEAQPRKVLKTVWHRDISAAKLILFRGN